MTASRVAPGVTWEGQQYPGVDKKGRVFILRTDTLQVYPVEGHELGEPYALDGAPLDNPDPVLDAAMDPHGDWVILEGFRPRWFRSGDEEPVPEPPWLPSSVSLLEGRPVVTVLPLATTRTRHGEPAPRVLRYDGDRWSVMVDRPGTRPATREEVTRMTEQEATHAYVDSDDTLWVAYEYRYKLTHYSAAGRELLSVEVDGAEVEHQAETELESRRLALEEERSRFAHPEAATVHLNTAAPVIRALTEGLDGRLYLLVRPGGGGLALDRLDTVRGVLARVATTAESPGTISMAAGAEGLYLVPFNGKATRWFVSWQDLDAADWSPLGGVEGLVPESESQEGF